jgi:hypothetical protein
LRSRHPFDVFRQPLDGEPVSADCKRHRRRLADVDRAVVEDDHNGLGSLARPWAMEPVKGFKKGDKIGAALSAGGGDDEFALGLVKRAYHGHFLRLTRRWNSKVRPALR